MVVFEKDTDFAVRSQGYGLTMQQVVDCAVYSVCCCFVSRVCVQGACSVVLCHAFVCVQGVAALQQLAVDVNSESVRHIWINMINMINMIFFTGVQRRALQLRPPRPSYWLLWYCIMIRGLWF